MHTNNNLISVTCLSSR